MRNRATARTRELKEAIVASFSEERDAAAERLAGFSEADWQSALWWLDMSGMAIYFLDQARRVGAGNLIPISVEAGLALRLERNRKRMQALLGEARKLAGWLEGGGVPYALLKGITLTPEPVPDAALRCQTDLDFLVPKGSADLAVQSIRRLGYKLHATRGNTLDFRAGEAGLPDMTNMYLENTERLLELHLIPDGGKRSGLLTRRATRIFAGARIATLSQADILVQQARHLLEHLCGEHTRLSWVLEFWRHVEARRFDREFWERVEILAAEERIYDLALGASLWLANKLFRCSAMGLPEKWRAEALPPRVLLWLERYAHDLFLSNSTGSKLYVLLRSEVPSGMEEPKKTHKLLLPIHLPERITRPRPDEGLLGRVNRYLVEAEFLFHRLRFHVVEGVRYVIEASRWGRAAARYGP